MPDSIADIASEAIFLAAGGRAILLQIADPAVGAGVDRHSDFASRPLDRLHGTMTYLYALYYGTDDDRAHVRRIVGRAHRPVQGVDSDGRVYSAFDPALQLWVAATIYDSAILIHERVFGPLGEADAQAMHRDAALIATALQVPPELWPATREEFAEYWTTARSGLDVTPAARHVASQLLLGVGAPRAARAVMPLVRLLTAGFLPPELRAPFGFVWTPRQERRFERVMRMLVPAYLVLPRRLRRALPGIYLRRLRSQE